MIAFGQWAGLTIVTSLAVSRPLVKGRPFRFIPPAAFVQNSVGQNSTLVPPFSQILD